MSETTNSAITLMSLQS